jgi:hypothetical protein
MAFLLSSALARLARAVVHEHVHDVGPAILPKVPLARQATIRFVVAPEQGNHSHSEEDLSTCKMSRTCSASFPSTVHHVRRPTRVSLCPDSQWPDSLCAERRSASSGKLCLPCLSLPARRKMRAVWHASQSYQSTLEARALGHYVLRACCVTCYTYTYMHGCTHPTNPAT